MKIKKPLSILLVIVMLLGMSSAFATSGNITRVLEYADINVIVNGQNTTLRDVNGNTVEPFIIDGTTYVPVRAVSEALGCGVAWDQKNTNVIVGDTSAPKYIFYMIGDGMGLAQRQLAECYTQYKTGDSTHILAMNDMPVTTNVTTNNATSLVTDSAAAATALATGQKTVSRIVGMDASGTKKLTSITEALQAEGMAIGLITTVNITHATPASFGAHVKDRDDENAIAAQYLSAGWDFLAGGGRRFFTDTTEGGKREEGDSLIDDFTDAGYTVDMSLSDYNGTDFSKVGKYLGIYEDKYFTPAIDQTYGTKTSPELYEIVESAIEALSRNEKGFFIMVEGGDIDGAAHNNDTAAMLYEVLAFEKAVQTAVDFYNEHPSETLIIVTGDHETGGLSLGYNSYSMNLAKLDEIKTSVAQSIDPLMKAGNTEGYYAAIEKHWGITLSDSDKIEIQARIDNFDVMGMIEDLAPADTPLEVLQKYESMKHMLGIGGYAASSVLAQYTKIGWGTQAHTGQPVPLTVMGAGSDWFATCRDNTDIPNTLAKLMGVSIG